MWRDYFSFCFERDPIDKVISDYRYRAGDRTFDQYVRDFPLPIDFHSYHAGGQRSVSFVGRFGALVEDLRTALSHVGIAFDGWLPRAKARDPRAGKVDLTLVQRQTIRERFQTEYDQVARSGGA